MADSI